MAARAGVTALISASLSLAGVAPAQLPVVAPEEAHSSEWWAHVGGKTLTAPARDSGLSRDIGAYYYAYASPEAIKGSLLQEHRVGGSGRLHVFHLPAGTDVPGTIDLQHSDRRSAMSALQQLNHGAVLGDTFPDYKQSEGYVNPLDDAGRKIEKAVVASITATNVMDQLKELTTLPDGTRAWSNDHASLQAVEFLEHKFKSMGLKVCIQKFDVKGHVMHNVVGFIEGSGSGTVTLGAHYDSRPFEGSAPGAEDNGSGVAALLAIARAYTDAKIKPSKPVYFVAFAGEEIGLYGSDHFADALMHPSDTSLSEECRASSGQGSSFLQRKALSVQELRQNDAIIMDEIGWSSKNLPKLTINLESYDTTGHVMDALFDASMTHNGDALEVVHSNNPFGSDHMSFLDRHMQAVLTINGDDEGYPNYHKLTDTIDNVNPEMMEKVTKMNLGAFIRLAGISGEV